MSIYSVAKNKYNQRYAKPYTSILPYLRAREEEKEEADKEPADKEPASSKTNVGRELDQYNKARLEILRGEEV